MPKHNIYIPKDLDDRLKKHREKINLSKLVQEILEYELILIELRESTE